MYAIRSYYDTQYLALIVLLDHQCPSRSPQNKNAPTRARKLVITSYSIHYTKLYDEEVVEAGDRPEVLLEDVDALLREDPTGKRARELTRRCTFDGEWDYLQSALTSRADYGFHYLKFESINLPFASDHLGINTAFKT